MEEVSWGVAPLIVSITEPERKMRNVGILYCQRACLHTRRVENVRAHAILPSDALLLVNVDLREGDLIWFGVFRRERLVRRSNSLARPTPVCIDCLGISHSN